MKKKKIKGVKPFNDFFLKSCYYHQLIAGTSCLGVDREGILLNTFPIIKDKFDTRKDWLFNERKLEKLLGYKSKHCNINKEKLIRCIDKGHPVIVGVDCYYFESRPDTYQIQHAPHFILVYGYDLEQKEVNVVDHQYRNSYEYKEKIISLDNVLFANKMFRKGVLNRKRSCYILKGKKNIGRFEIWKYIDEEKVNNNLLNSLKNLKELRRMATFDLELVHKNIEKIINYLNDLKTFYYTLSKTKVFNDIEEKQVSIMSLVNAYSNILSLFWKVNSQNNYEYITKHLESILRKIDEIERLEKIVYDLLLEAKKNNEPVYSNMS